MNKKLDPPSKEPEKIHQDQVILNILMPILATVVICVGAFLFILIGNTTQPQSAEQWANISIMFLILPAVFLGLIVLLLLILLTKLTRNWNKHLPSPLRSIRQKAIGLNQTVQAAAQKPAKLLITISSFFSGIKGIFKK
jgi:hypothetical protein